MITIYPNNENVSHENEYYIDAPNFWYLHGKLEYYFNYDKAEMYVDEKTRKKNCFRYPTPNDSLYLEQGIYTVHVENYKRKCRAYLWTQTYEDNTMTLRGLIVDAYSIKDNLYAYRKYKKQSLVL